MNILFIEDNPEFASAITTLLIDRGHNVTLCDNADDAVQAIPTLEKYRVIILDIMMMLGSVVQSSEGRETGIAIYKRIRKVNPKIRIVVLTAQNKMDIWADFQQDTNVLFHHKPPQMPMLYKQIEG